MPGLILLKNQPAQARVGILQSAISLWSGGSLLMSGTAFVDFSWVACVSVNLRNGTLRVFQLVMISPAGRVSAAFERIILDER